MRRPGPVESFYRATDCLDGLRGMRSGSVALAFCDLPYGKTQNRWDRRVPMGPLWEQLLRVGRPDCVFVFTAIQPFTSLVTCSNLSMFRFDMVWRKNKAAGHLNAKKRPMRAHEDLLLFWAKTPVYRPQMTEGHAPMHHAVRRRASTNYGSQRGAQPNKGATTRYPTTVLDIPVLNNDDPERCNATQKPMALPAWFIKTYTKPGDLVLDPTAGSGTTLRAAQELGRCFAGFDMDVELVRQVNERWLFPGKERAA